MMTPEIKRALEAKISAHPFAAVAIALVAGAMVALARGTRDLGPSKRTIRSAFVGGISALAVGVVKDALLGHLSGAAKSWLDADGAMSAAPSSQRDPASSFTAH